MRFESVRAHAFGPFTDASLDLAPGLNLIFGPNEAGKSSWHAALFAGLCGMRRGRGGGRKEDQEFAERHRPWDGREWRVGATVTLADGRRLELEHDLIGRVDCRATDTVLGRDCSAEIMHEGAPDGSRWLGLDRRSFLATACVPQSDLLDVLKEPALLQEHLQRAAATSGADSTAAGAIERIKAFHGQQVGQDRANSQRPLPSARRQVEAARATLERARREHRDYLALAAQAQAEEATAAAAERARALHKAAAARAGAVEAEARLARARDLAARFPDGRPAGLAEQTGLLQDVAAALLAWDSRPPAPRPDGERAAALRAELDTLPATPTGDLDVHPGIRAAGQAFRDAAGAVRRHAGERPAAVDAPDSGGASADELREWARDLAEPGSGAAPPRAAGPSIGVLAAGAALALIGVALLAFGLLPPGLALLLLGGGLAGWAVLGGRGATPAATPGSDRRDAALARIHRRDLPEDAAALRDLAQRLVAAQRAAEAAAAWDRRAQSLEAERLRAGEALRAALLARGAGATAQPAADLERYEQDCRQRAAQARQAARRGDLEQRLAAREQIEAEAAVKVRQRGAAERRLRGVARRCGLADGDPPALVAGLRAWRAEQADAAGRADTAAGEWAELELLLQGQTPQALAATTQQVRAHADALAAPFAAAELDAERAAATDAGRPERLEAAERAARAAFQGTQAVLVERGAQVVGVAEAEERLAEAEAALARVQALGDTLDLTARFLEAAQERIHRDVAPKLAAAVGGWLPGITAGRYPEVRVDPRSLVVQVRGDGGHWRTAALLSHGTAEQIYLLLRVAMAQHLTRAGEVCPLILDDVTVQCDSRRTRAVLEMLRGISAERQVILFSQEAEVLAWAREHLRAPTDRVVELDPAAVAA